MINFEQENYNKVHVAVTLILILFFCITGATYAYYAFTATNETISGEAAVVNLTLTVDKIFPMDDSDTTGTIVPQISTSGSNVSPLSAALKKGCVDDNKNIVCQVYKIVIENVGGTATQVVDGSISFYSDAALTTDVSVEMPNLKWKLIESVDINDPTNSVLGTNIDLTANFSKNVFAKDVTLVNDTSLEYYMIIWINETSNEQEKDEGKSFYSKVEFNSSNGTGVTSMFTS